MMKVLITGATGAIGEQIALHMASRGFSLLLACRSVEKARGIIAKISESGAPEAKVIKLDLSDSASVRAAAAEIIDAGVEAVINNAGTMNGTYRRDPDGYEDTLNVNYHNTRLLNELIIPSIPPGGSIVFTTSLTRFWFPSQKRAEDISQEEFSRLRAYALSKKLITEYAARLSKKLWPHDLYVNCCDPGVVDSPMLKMGKWFDPVTDLIFRPFCFSPATGADAAFRAFNSDLTGRIFTAPFGSISMPTRLFRE